jgi:hypothetical protein
MLYPPEMLHKMILSIVVSLMNDDVFIVRKKAATGLGAIFLRLTDESPEYRKDMVNLLKAFFEYRSFTKRQLYPLIVQKIAEDP